MTKAGVANKPGGVKEKWHPSKGQRQCFIAILVILGIIGISVYISPTEEDEVAKAAAAKAKEKAKTKEKNGVAILNDDNFDNFIAAHPDGVLVDFYSDSCKFCAKLAPEFESAAKLLKAKGGKPLASINSDVGAKKMKEFDISRYPSVFWFLNGEAVLELPRAAEKNASEIEAWMDWADTPGVEELPRADFVENIELLRGHLHATHLAIVGSKKDGGVDIRPLLDAAAQRYRQSSAFIYTPDGQAEDPILKAYGPDASKDVEFTGPWEKKDVVEWVKKLQADAKAEHEKMKEAATEDPATQPATEEKDEKEASPAAGQEL